MIVRTLLATGGALAGLVSTPVLARDTASGAEAAVKGSERVASAPMPATFPSEAIVIVVSDGREVVWTGSLRLGGPYGNASFSQSRSEYGEVCVAEPGAPGRQVNSNESLNFNISRSNALQEPDRFSLSLNWSRPVARCQGEGTDNYGFTRSVIIPLGQSVTVSGSGTMSVKLTRAR